MPVVIVKFPVLAPVNVPVPTINLSALSSNPINALFKSPLSITIPESLPGVPDTPLPNSISVSAIIELVVASVVVVPFTFKFPVMVVLPPTVKLSATVTSEVPCPNVIAIPEVSVAIFKAPWSFVIYEFVPSW